MRVLISLDAVKGFDPSELRDASGRWKSSAAREGIATYHDMDIASPERMDALAERYPVDVEPGEEPPDDAYLADDGTYYGYNNGHPDDYANAQKDDAIRNLERLGMPRWDAENATVDAVQEYEDARKRDADAFYQSDKTPAARKRVLIKLARDHAVTDPDNTTDSELEMRASHVLHYAELGMPAEEHRKLVREYLREHRAARRGMAKGVEGVTSESLGPSVPQDMEGAEDARLRGERERLEALLMGEEEVDTGEMTKGVELKPGEHWITMHGRHVVITEDGKIVRGQVKGLESRKLDKPLSDRQRVTLRKDTELKALYRDDKTRHAFSENGTSHLWGSHGRDRFYDALLKDDPKAHEYADEMHAAVHRILGDPARKAEQAKRDADEAYESQGHRVKHGEEPSKLRGKKVWLYHGTSDKFHDDITRGGLQIKKGVRSNVGSSAIRSSRSLDVKLTSDPSMARTYARSAANKHGGEPTVYRVLVDGSRLTRDRDDMDISSGKAQYAIPYVEPHEIMEADGRRLQPERDAEKGKRLPESSIVGWRTNPEDHHVFPITSEQEAAHPLKNPALHDQILESVAAHHTGERGGSFSKPWNDPKYSASVGHGHASQTMLDLGHAVRLHEESKRDPEQQSARATRADLPAWARKSLLSASERHAKHAADGVEAWRTRGYAKDPADVPRQTFVTQVVGASGADDPRPGAGTLAGERHRLAVKKRLEGGGRVDADVLEDYPELGRKYANATTPQEEQSGASKRGWRMSPDEQRAFTSGHTFRGYRAAGDNLLAPTESGAIYASAQLSDATPYRLQGSGVVPVHRLEITPKKVLDTRRADDAGVLAGMMGRGAPDVDDLMRNGATVLRPDVKAKLLARGYDAVVNANESGRHGTGLTVAALHPGIVRVHSSIPVGDTQHAKDTNDEGVEEISDSVEKNGQPGMETATVPGESKPERSKIMASEAIDPAARKRLLNLRLPFEASRGGVVVNDATLRAASEKLRKSPEGDAAHRVAQIDGELFRRAKTREAVAQGIPEVSVAGNRVVRHAGVDKMEHWFVAPVGAHAVGDRAVHDGLVEPVVGLGKEFTAGDGVKRQYYYFAPMSRQDLAARAE